MRLILVAGATRTAEVEGITAAGASRDLLVHTPSADAEIVSYGDTIRAPVTPVSPSGCPTPAVVTRAVRELLGFDVAVVDAPGDVAGAQYDLATPADLAETVDRVEARGARARGIEADLRDDADRLTARADRVRVLDLKGLYEGTEVDQEPDAEFYEWVLESFPNAVIEDPAITEETRPVFAGEEDRVSWDYPITGVESVENLPWEPSWLNVKPSRFGTLESLSDTLVWAREHDVTLYGGGQFELGVGRDQLHALASVFYPDGPNDVAPGAFNDPEVPERLPGSPLAPSAAPRGFEF